MKSLSFQFWLITFVLIPIGAALSDPPGVSVESPNVLKVILCGESEVISGYMVVFEEGERNPSHAKISGKGRAEAVFPSLRPGLKQVVFIPHSSHAPTNQQVRLSPGVPGEVALRLNPAPPFEGVVVDQAQEPLEGAYVRVTMKGVVPICEARNENRLIFNRGHTNIASCPGRSSVSSRSDHLYSDGSISIREQTDDEGRFSIEGVTGTVVDAEIEYEDAKLSQSCPLNRDEVCMVLPVIKKPQPEEMIDDEEDDDLSRSIRDLMMTIGEHPELGEAYWPQIRELMTQRLAKSSLSEKEKVQQQQYIDGLGRKAQDQ